jgi:hypothetical protein
MAVGTGQAMAVGPALEEQERHPEGQVGCCERRRQPHRRIANLGKGTDGEVWPTDGRLAGGNKQPYEV